MQELDVKNRRAISLEYSESFADVGSKERDAIRGIRRYCRWHSGRKVKKVNEVPAR